LSADVRGRLEVIDESLERAARKLRSLLFIAQNQRERQLVQISELADDLLVLVNYRLVMNKVTLETNNPKALRWHGAPSLLGRALLFILDNALEAMAALPEPTLTFVADQSGSDCHIRIADSGPGIQADLRKRVFEPFFTTKGPPHNGIGL